MGNPFSSNQFGHIVNKLWFLNDIILDKAFHKFDIELSFSQYVLNLNDLLDFVPIAHDLSLKN